MVACQFVPLHVCSGSAFYCEPASRPYWPQEYYILLGDSQIGKGVATHDIVGRILEQVNPELKLPRSPAPGALLEELQEKRHAVLLNDDLGMLLARRESRAHLPSLLVDLWNHEGRFERTLKRERFAVQQPGLSLMLGAEPATMQKYVDERELKQSLMSRFVICAGQKSQKKEPRKDSLVLAKALRRLRALAGFAKAVTRPLEMPVEKLAADAVRDEAEKLRARVEKTERNEDLTGYYHGVEEHLFKMGMMVAVDEQLDALLHALEAVLPVGVVESLGAPGSTDAVTVLLSSAGPTPAVSASVLRAAASSPGEVAAIREYAAQRAKRDLLVGAAVSGDANPPQVTRVWEKWAPVLEKKHALAAISVFRTLVTRCDAALLQARSGLDMRLFLRALRGIAKFQQRSRDLVKDKEVVYFHRGPLLAWLGLPRARVEPVLKWMVENAVLDGPYIKTPPHGGSKMVRYRVLKDVNALLAAEAGARVGGEDEEAW